MATRYMIDAGPRRFVLTHFRFETHTHIHKTHARSRTNKTDMLITSKVGGPKWLARAQPVSARMQTTAVKVLKK